MRGDYLYIEATGTFSIDEACRSFHDALAVIEKHGATKVLINCLQLTGTPGTMDYYTYGECVAEELRKSSLAERRGTLKLAHVAAAPLLDPDRLSAVVATNRGANMKSVDTVEKALEWLKNE
jgi:hypothetical protein